MIVSLLPLSAIHRCYRKGHRCSAISAAYVRAESTVWNGNVTPRPAPLASPGPGTGLQLEQIDERSCDDAATVVRFPSRRARARRPVRRGWGISAPGSHPGDQPDGHPERRAIVVDDAGRETNEPTVTSGDGRMGPGSGALWGCGRGKEVDIPPEPSPEGLSLVRARPHVPTLRVATIRHFQQSREATS